MQLLRWFFRPPLIMATVMGLFLVTGVLSWRIWLIIVSADIADDLWQAVRLWRQRDPSAV